MNLNVLVCVSFISLASLQKIGPRRPRPRVPVQGLTAQGFICQCKCIPTHIMSNQSWRRKGEKSIFLRNLRSPMTSKQAITSTHPHIRTMCCTSIVASLTRSQGPSLQTADSEAFFEPNPDPTLNTKNVGGS